MRRSLLCCMVALCLATTSAKADVVILSQRAAFVVRLTAGGVETVTSDETFGPPFERHSALTAPFAAATVDFQFDGLAGTALATAFTSRPDTGVVTATAAESYLVRFRVDEPSLFQFDFTGALVGAEAGATGTQFGMSLARLSDFTSLFAVFSPPGGEVISLAGFLGPDTYLLAVDSMAHAETSSAGGPDFRSAQSSFNLAITPVPEPSTWLLGTFGFCSLAVACRLGSRLLHRHKCKAAN